MIGALMVDRKTLQNQAHFPGNACPRASRADFSKASLLAKNIDEKLTATYGSKLNHHLEALKLLSEIEGLLSGETYSKNFRALGLINGIRERLNAQYGSKPNHRLEAQKMLSELDAILSCNG